ncbi:cytochrome P450 [Sphaerosporella brunnea]|uniref:Cytochrome P450 n=1 Tax=Sphaerosporella brunnea TaxID=1250544 RepID=A0A5J5EN42_9PEZI|nr:cytochrome P450 [Sphaerosporella brunnea]
MAVVVWLTAGVLVLTAYLLHWQTRVKPSNAPTLHSSFVQKVKHLGGMTALLHSAYKTHNQGTFQYVTIRGRRQVVVSSDKLITELKNAPHEILSFARWTQDLIEFDTILPLYTGGQKLVQWPPLVQKLTHRFFKGPMTKDLATNFPDLFDDLVYGFSKAPQDAPVYTLVRCAVLPAVARQIIGAPLCRDEEFLKNTDEMTHLFGVAPQLAGMFPGKFLKRLAVRYLTRWETVKRYIEEACEAQAKDLNRPKGKDFFSLSLAAIEMNGAKGTGEMWDIPRLATEVCSNFFAAHHTTSATIAMALLELAVRPEYQPILREEVRQAVDEKGWSMDAIDSLEKLDSFLVEMRRWRPLADMMLNRAVIRETTLSDGTILKPGTYISASYSARQLDPRYYTSPEEFDGMRFYKLRKEGDQGRLFTDVDGTLHLGFGGGKHPCPGRFFATAVVKLGIAYLLNQYQVLPGSEKLEMEMHFEEQRLPSMKDKVVFKKL